jgi:hypothetical protein
MLRFLHPHYLLFRLLAFSLLTPGILAPATAIAQVDEDQLGGWYSWFYNRNIKDTPWATQMILQSRNWDLGSDMQQTLAQILISYKPDQHPIRYGVGFYHLRHGEFGPATNLWKENILFQQGLYSTVWGEKNYLTLRMRLEEHFPEQRTNHRILRNYLSLNRPLNQSGLSAGAWYLSLYDEYFINLNEVEFAVNRIYAGIGYKATDHTSWQFGFMQQNTRSVDKGQLMFNLFHHY